MTFVARAIVRVATVATVASTPLAVAQAPDAPSEEQSALEVVVSGFPSDLGAAQLGLYASREAYEDEDRRPDSSARLSIVDGRVTWRVDSLSPGEYAVRVYHDANDNARLDKGRRGIPLEPYGFSNNPPRRKGPADWSEARFTLPAGSTTIEIDLLAPPREVRS